MNVNLDHLITLDLLEEGYTFTELPEKLIEQKQELERALLELLEEVKKQFQTSDYFQWQLQVMDNLNWNLITYYIARIYHRKSTTRMK